MGEKVEQGGNRYLVRWNRSSRGALAGSRAPAAVAFCTIDAHFVQLPASVVGRFGRTVSLPARPDPAAVHLAPKTVHGAQDDRPCPTADCQRGTGLYDDHARTVCDLVAQVFDLEDLPGE